MSSKTACYPFFGCLFMSIEHFKRLFSKKVKFHGLPIEKLTAIPESQKSAFSTDIRLLAQNNPSKPPSYDCLGVISSKLVLLSAIFMNNKSN